ncbi:type II secretion system protein [Candidatus Saccharibacteria bacterium TM7i]|nr:type II secretion system protein [Candidatus Saccharibacteria bacterium TM7i]
MILKKEKLVGFTIVELLIVIVVIAILATITVVAYEGISVKARNASTLHAIKTYEKALKSYASQHDAYPDFWGSVCLGEGYLDRNNDSLGDCGAEDYPALESTAFNASLRTIVSSLPPVSTKSISAPGGNIGWVGAFIMRWDDITFNGHTAPYTIAYILEGSAQQCGHGATMETIPGQNWPTTRTSTTGYSWTDSRSTVCHISLPNPSQL